MPTPQNAFHIRPALPQDVPRIHAFIMELAEYEQMADQVTATEADIHHSLFVRHEAEVLLGEEAGQAVAFALYFHNYSTFLGRANLYLEDLYVQKTHRGKGYGKAMLAALAAVATQRGCKRMDWWCLNWNKSSLDFYRALGAVAMDEWTVLRLQGPALDALAAEAQ